MRTTNFSPTCTRVQKRLGIPEDGKLELIEETIRTARGNESIRFPNFSVEMETGTGKTYVYLRTALELHRRYGLRKFIVVVPSVAVREGVLKSLKITQDHLRAIYDNVPYRFTVYDSKSIGKVRQFAQSDCVEILVMTIDSFNKDDNVIRQSTDRLQGATPLFSGPGRPARADPGRAAEHGKRGPRSRRWPRFIRCLPCATAPRTAILTTSCTA